MVYLGDDLRLGRNVAIKIMHAHLADDENFTKRFEQEARSAAGLGHPNVVNVFDQGESNGVPYLVMEYLPGITLRDLLKQRRKLVTDEAAEISEAVLAGLAAAHEAGIVHRDLKPENVLLADDGRIKIGDFGLARAVSANTTTGQALLGTIAYLSPELVTRGIADERSDLYAFGIMLFEMLTGSQPYTGEQPMQIAYQHAHSDVPLPSSLAPEVPQEFDQLVQWTTQRDPDARPSDGRQALEFLREVRLGGATAAVKFMPRTAALPSVTPSTAVLSDGDMRNIADGVEPAIVDAERDSRDAEGQTGVATHNAQRAGNRRSRRGRWIAAILTLMLAVAAGAGWWWGQGPGSSISVPEVSGLEMTEAQNLLENASLSVEPFQCSSLEVAEGFAARTEPIAGSLVERGSTVKLCQSTGPEMLPVPPLVGMSLDAAKIAIEEAKFTFGSVIQETFDGGEKGTVILAVNAEGAGLSDTYPEQGVIDLIVSAGSVPEVTGLSPEGAMKALSDAGISVDSALNSESHHEDIEAGKVITLVSASEILNVGDSVGLQLSLGPELFNVPDVTGLRMRKAVDALREAGFEPVTGIPEALWGAVEVSGTDPEAGTQLPRGAKIELQFDL